MKPSLRCQYIEALRDARNPNNGHTAGEALERLTRIQVRIVKDERLRAEDRRILWKEARDSIASVQAWASPASSREGRL